MAANGETADDGRVTDLATTTNTRLDGAGLRHGAVNGGRLALATRQARSAPTQLTHPKKQQQWVNGCHKPLRLTGSGWNNHRSPSARTVLPNIRKRSVDKWAWCAVVQRGNYRPDGHGGRAQITISKTLTRGCGGCRSHPQTKSITVGGSGWIRQ